MGHGMFRMQSGDVAALRRKPGPIPEGWAPPSPSLLRNSDEQTIAGLCAVFTAIDRIGLPRDRYQGWGVVAASRFLGRANLARALESFLAEGVWGTSPHLIPHYALHSASGTISLGLGLHGPNLGVGGGLSRCRRGLSGRSDVVVDRQCARRLARAQRLVAGAGAVAQCRTHTAQGMPGSGDRAGSDEWSRRPIGLSVERWPRFSPCRRTRGSGRHSRRSLAARAGPGPMRWRQIHSDACASI